LPCCNSSSALSRVRPKPSEWITCLLNNRPSVALKKSELYSSLWKSCDELRGGMDASQYKDYVLVLLFVKYVSDKYAGNPNALIDVPPGGSFADMVALKNDKEIGDKINKLVGRLADANDSLKGAINVADFNDEEKLGKGKEMVDRLTKLVGIFEGLDFGRNRAEGDDLLGDAYEYLMRHFATESGKSKGQFYTPAEVSRVMAQVIELGRATDARQSIFDPTCGSGSLLLKAHDEAKSRTGLDLALYGQEMDNATAALSRMNMVLHDCPTAEIWRDNTLANPHFLGEKYKAALQTFDYVVANPPFSTKAWSNGFDPLNDVFERFEYGVPPAKNGDFAFLLHILKTLKSTGKGAVILPHGVLFRGGAEGSIRANIVRRGFIKGIIGLPANLFYGTGIPACIIVLDKEGAAGRTMDGGGIFMVDASKGFIKDGNKNRLRAQDMHRIVDTFTRQDGSDPKYARLVPLAEIAANDYNLNLPRYIDSTEPEDLQDIEAHLKGGIPLADIDGLHRYWQVLPGVREALFAPLADAARSNAYCQLKVEPQPDQGHHLWPQRVHHLQPDRHPTLCRLEGCPHTAAHRHPVGRPAQGAD
jgi:type I restriction enzyme M protein